MIGGLAAAVEDRHRRTVGGRRLEGLAAEMLLTQHFGGTIGAGVPGLLLGSLRRCLHARRRPAVEGALDGDKTWLCGRSATLRGGCLAFVGSTRIRLRVAAAVSAGTRRLCASDVMIKRAARRHSWRTAPRSGSSASKRRGRPPDRRCARRAAADVRPLGRRYALWRSGRTMRMTMEMRERR